MGKKLVSNPISSGVVFKTPEEVEKKLAALELELIQERAIKKSGIKEVIKIEEKIVYQDDPSLLKRLNETLMELGRLKAEKSNVVKLMPNIQIQEKEVVKEITKLVFDRKKAIIFGVISYGLGFICALSLARLIGFPL